jgi:SAM-dependent methyltransferase
MKGLPPILDATCGARMMWFDKHNPLALFVDKRTLPPTELCDGRMFEVSPDMEVDFTAMPFRDNSFSLVVFDPPHLIRAGDDAYMTIKYGRLPRDWRDELRRGFSECMRVLRPQGTLIFKWNETQITTGEIVRAVGAQPLFGHKSGRREKTHWMTFMKLPDELRTGER